VTGIHADQRRMVCEKILVAIDGSKHSSRVIEYCGKQFSGMSDLSLTLFHVLPNLPTRFWDDGHILTKKEKDARQEVVDKWLENRKLATSRCSAMR